MAYGQCPFLSPKSHPNLNHPVHVPHEPKSWKPRMGILFSHSVEIVEWYLCPEVNTAFLPQVYLFSMDIRPNHTIYINNLNEKIKKDGEYLPHESWPANLATVNLEHYSTYLHLFMFSRTEEVLVRHLLPVWPNSGYCGSEDIEDAWPGFCHLQRHQQCHQCLAKYARIPLLWQTHGKLEIFQLAWFFL